MASNKGEVMRSMVSQVLKLILYIAYISMKIFSKDSYHNLLAEPAHLERPPDRPIDSLALYEALDPDTPVNRLQRILTHEDHYIRRALARNPALPMESLVQLTHDPHQEVSAEARRIMQVVNNFNKNVKPETLSLVNR